MNPNNPKRDPHAEPRIEAGKESQIEDAQEQIAAYVCGDMDGVEREAFEKRLTGESALRRETEAFAQALDAAKSWMNAPPPGLDKVAEIPIPVLRPIPVPKPAAPPAATIKINALRWMAAAALFLMGMATGYWLLPAARGANNAPDSGLASRIHGTNATYKTNGTNAASASDMSHESHESHTSHSSAASASAAPAPAAVPAAAPSPAPPRTFRESNGRVIVESTLSATGGQVVWVVDGSFQLAQANSYIPGGPQ